MSRGNEKIEADERSYILCLQYCEPPCLDPAAPETYLLIAAGHGSRGVVAMNDKSPIQRGKHSHLHVNSFATKRDS